MQRVAASVAVLTASASATDVSPIGKVVQMLGDLQAKVIKEGETAQVSYAEFSEWCEDRARELTHEIKTGTADVEGLKASIADSTTSAQALSSKIDSLASDIATDEADLEAARKVRSQESKTFKAEDAELVETIDMVERAKNILEREMAKGSAALVQIKDAQNVASALSAMVEASMMSSADATKLTALVQSTQAWKFRRDIDGGDDQNMSPEAVAARAADARRDFVGGDDQNMHPDAVAARAADARRDFVGGDDQNMSPEAVAARAADARRDFVGGDDQNMSPEAVAARAADARRDIDGGDDQNMSPEAVAARAADARRDIDGGDDQNEQPVNAPAAAVYENQSGNVVDTLQDLLEKASAQLDAARKTEMANKHAFEMLAQSLGDEIRFAEQSMDKTKKALAQANEAKAAAEGNLQVSSKELAADTEAKGHLHQDCMNRAEDFEAETKSRAEELKALAEGKRVIQESTGGATGIAYGAESFLQTSALTTSADLKGFQAVRMVRDLARRENSAALTQLSLRLASVRGSGASDPFEKIKGLISDMVQKLEAQAAADATKKAHCDKELGDSNAKKAELTANVERLTTRIDQNTATANKLRAQVAVLQQQLAKLAASQADMDKMRASENEEYTSNKADMEQGLQGVKAALKVLNEYYAQEDKAHNVAEGAGASIIGLLEVIESDFSKNLAEIESTEDSAANDYDRETKENEIEKAAKTKGVEYKTKQAAALAKQAQAQSADLANEQAQLDSVLEYLSSLDAECSEKVESYAERKGHREAELAGLKEALNTLETETAFVQVQHRRFLGASKHIH